MTFIKEKSAEQWMTQHKTAKVTSLKNNNNTNHLDKKLIAQSL